MRNTLAAAVLLAALSILSRVGAADAGETIGVVRSASGVATVTRGDQVLVAAPGVKLQVDDALDTGPDGSLGIVLPLSRPWKPSRRPEVPLLPGEGNVRPAGAHLARDHGVPLGRHRENGARDRPFRHPDGHHRHPGNALRREGRGTFRSMTPMRSRVAGQASRGSRRSLLYPLASVLLLAAACATTPKPAPPPSRDVVVLLPDDRGKTGAIVVSSAGVERRLDRPRQTVSVEAGAPPGSPSVMEEQEVRAIVGPALAALPKPPAQFILYFRHDSTDLTAESRALLPTVLRTILERAPVDISVVGHTDTVGKDRYNSELSLRRAKAVAAILVGKGIDPSVLDITSHGKENPLVPTGDQVPEPRNRRVEITVR